MIGSDYEEVPGPHKSSLRRELLNVYRGRFCFSLGAGVRCGGAASFTITQGERRTLEMGLDLPLPIPLGPTIGAKAGIEYEHTFAQAIGPWPLGDCDSMFPVLCFDDAEVKRFRNRRLIKRYALSAFTEVFRPRAGDHGWAYPNVLRNDPLCDCHDADKPTRAEQTREETEETVPAITIVRPTAFEMLAGSDEPDYDPESAAREVGQALEEIISDEDDAWGGDRAVGIARSDGVILWLGNAEQPTSGPSLVLLPSGPSSLPRRLATYDLALAPVVAVGRPSSAAYCELRVLARLGNANELSEIAHERAAIDVRAEIMTVWAQVNFAELGPDATGIVELQLRDETDQPVGYPVREAFATDPLALVPATA